MNGANAVIAPQMGFSFKGAVAGDPSCFFGNLSNQRQHLIGDGKWRYIMFQVKHLAFLSIIRRLAQIIKNLHAILTGFLNGARFNHFYFGCYLDWFLVLEVNDEYESEHADDAD